MQSKLASSLFGLPQEWNDISEEEAEKLWREIVSLEENVLENSTSTELRNWAVQLLCYVYPRLQMQDKAEELAKTMPNVYQCREELFCAVSQGTKRFHRMQDAIKEHLDCLLIGIAGINMCLDDGRMPYTTEEEIELYKKVIEILNVVIEDDNYGFFRSRMS